MEIIDKRKLQKYIYSGDKKLLKLMYALAKEKKPGGKIHKASNGIIV